MRVHNFSLPASTHNPSLPHAAPHTQLHHSPHHPRRPRPLHLPMHYYQCTTVPTHPLPLAAPPPSPIHTLLSPPHHPCQPPPPCSPAPFIAGSGPGSVFDFRNIGPGSDPANDPCEYFDLGRNKASTLALSVLGEAWG